MRPALSRVLPVFLLPLFLLVPACADDNSEEEARMVKARQEQAQVEDEKKKERLRENEQQLEADESSMAKPAGKPDRASPFVDRSCKLTIKATFTDLPAGARVIAASARDGRFQKVTRSEHAGASGAVLPAEDGHNLFFVSDALKTKTVDYVANYEITRRVGTQGSLDIARGAPWPASAPPKVGEVSEEAAIVALAGKLGGDDLKPHAIVHAAMAEAMKPALGENGSDSAAAVAGGSEATAHGVASLLAEVLSVRGVPARVMQGVHRTKLEGEAKRVHAWTEVQLPGLSWVPFDPALRRRHQGGEEDPTFLGTIPADRVTFIIGDEAVLAEDGTFPRTTLSGSIAAPFALLDGKRVGTVTWSATFTPISGTPK
jgi:hypothetical protein